MEEFQSCIPLHWDDLDATLQAFHRKALCAMASRRALPR
jgi:hypothetical protein